MDGAKVRKSAVSLVVASRKSDNTTWLVENFPDWQKEIYVTDDRRATLKVPANKGREGMVYLTYIIDRYDKLPEVIVFQHAKQYQWHNDDPLYDGLRMLSRLQVPFIRQQGYVNLRCVWTIGCPDEVRPFNEEAAALPEADPRSKKIHAGPYYRHAFEHLFPGVTVPETIGSSCCAQFAVTAKKVRERPRSDYEHFRRWLLETELNDDLSGRVLEYSWHIIFGQAPVYCPTAQHCYCNVYGLCGLGCENAGQCRSQYTLPAYSTLPNGWPDYDWDNNWRNITEMRVEQSRDFTPITT